MSQTRAWSWRHAIIKSALPATTRHVLLTISCFMNELGDGCYPTQVQLAEATGLSERAVREHLEKAESLGWIKRQEHGFKGQKWRNHEYSASWPETQDVEKGAEPASGPSDKAAEPHAETCGTSRQKVRHHVPTTSPNTTPSTSPSGAQARAGGDFDILWTEWPDPHRPDNREAAKAFFQRLSSEEQVQAVATARDFRKLCVTRKEPVWMITYLKDRRFLELVGAPPVGKDGNFIITPDRPEWSHWLGAVRSQYGPNGIESVIKLGFMLRKTRFPSQQLASA